MLGMTELTDHRILAEVRLMHGKTQATFRAMGMEDRRKVLDEVRQLIADLESFDAAVFKKAMKRVAQG